MKEIAAMICKLAVELYDQLVRQIDNPEELESFTLDTERTNGYSYKITISREKTSEGGINNE